VHLRGVAALRQGSRDWSLEGSSMSGVAAESTSTTSSPPSAVLLAGAAAAAAVPVARRWARRRRHRHSQGGVLVCRAAAGGEAGFLIQVLREVKELVVLQKSEEETLQKLVHAMDEVHVEAGEVIVRQGEKDSSMYVIAVGDVVIERAAAGSEAPLTRPAARGDYFGAVALLGRTPQKTTVRAKTACTLWRLDGHKFDEVVIQGEAPDDEEDEDDEDDEDDEEEDGVACTTDALREIFIVSDSTGESARASVQTALRQFDYCFGSTCGTSRTVVYRFVRTANEVKQIVDRAKEQEALLVFTVMEPKIHEALTTACKEQGIDCCDLWGTLLESLERKFGAKRSGVTGRRQAVSDEYMRIVQAIEYTRKVDDGVLPNQWDDCDIMLVGPSRAGKTPLSFYLAQRGFKVANYPLVPDEDPPPELFQIDQNKCFGLTISPEKLQAIRIERMKQFGRSSTQYGRLDNIKKEVSWIKNFYIRKGPTWPTIDTSNAGVVETAARIMEIMDRRKGDALAASYVSVE